MYYEVHGGGEPVVLLHGAFMTITNNWAGWIGELSKTRKVIAVEMQGHGRTADVPRDITYENLADDVAALLNYLKIPRADLIGYSMGGAVAMQCAIRHPDKVRRAVIISSTFRRDGMVAEALEAIPKLTADAFKGSPIEAEYKKLSPTPDDFPNFVQRLVATASRGYDSGADKLKATTTPMFFIHGDADGVRLAHVGEMFRLKGGEIHGDLKPRSASRLAILPDTTHSDTDAAHTHHRPDGERLSRRKAVAMLRSRGRSGPVFLNSLSPGEIGRGSEGSEQSRNRLSASASVRPQARRSIQGEGSRRSTNR